MALEFVHENIWYDKWRYDDAECQYYEKQFGGSAGLGNLASQIAKAREEIQSSLANESRLPTSASTNVVPDTVALNARVDGMINDLERVVAKLSSLEKMVMGLCKVVGELERHSKSVTVAPQASASPPQIPTKEENEGEDEVDLFGSDDEEEDDAAAKLREKRLKAYAEKKAKNPRPIAKSSVLLDCKPWDDETDMQKMEEVIRNIQMDGLTWGAAKYVPLAYGIKKLSILCIVEDKKVSVDDLMDQIVEIEDYVQSVDIGAFNKI